VLARFLRFFVICAGLVSVPWFFLSWLRVFACWVSVFVCLCAGWVAVVDRFLCCLGVCFCWLLVFVGI
jgi:hypothetical protein